MTDYASTLEYRPWSSLRLARLSADLRDASGLGGVGAEGRAAIVFAAEYVDALVASSHTTNAMARDTAERVRRIRNRKQRRVAP